MSASPLEIERVWLLTGAPCIPEHALVWKIEQGYLPIAGHDMHASDFAEGRIRRIQQADGRVECLQTIKRGSGLVREETERTISIETFQQLWPSTQGCRIRKIRHRVSDGISDGDLLWEVDQFLDWPLWLAEVELPRVDAPVFIPMWLKPVLGEEVTHNARWRNHALATLGPPAL